MDNFGWEISSSMMPPNIWVNQYENNICETEANYETFHNSNVEMQVADNSSMGIEVNEMLGRMAVPANFNSIANSVDLDNFFFTYHQPEITNSLGPLPEDLIQSSQELQILNPRVNYDYMISSCNFSSGESEAASQGSSQTNSSKQNKNSKRKLEDMQSYYSQCASIAEKGFQIHFDRPKNSKRPKFMKETSGANIDFRQEKNKESFEADTEAIAEVKEMMYKAAAMRPINLVLAETAVDRPKRKNVKISSDPQTVAARQRRERISERLRVLQKLVPGGSKMDTASMLHEAANYLKFLKSQVSTLETLGTNSNSSSNDFQAPNFLMFCKMDNPL